MNNTRHSASKEMMGTAGVKMQGELHGFRLRLSSAVYFWKSGEKVNKVKKGEKMWPIQRFVIDNEKTYVYSFLLGFSLTNFWF